MSMKINDGYSGYSNYDNYKTKEQEGQRTERGDAMESRSAEASQDVSGRSGAAFERQDEYISSEKSGIHAKPTGLYRMEQDENGNPKVLFDDPKKAGNADGAGQPKQSKEAPDAARGQGEQEEECTGNTDRVDREIAKLKEEKRQLEQKLRMTSGNEDESVQWGRKLAQVENELRQKDNDTYRRQHTVFS